MNIEEEKLKPVPVREEAPSPIMSPFTSSDLLINIVIELQEKISKLEKELEEIKNEINI